MVLKKAVIKVLDTNKTIKVLFNPNEYVLERKVNYAEHKVNGLDAPIMQFVNGDSDTLSMNLFFDTYATGSESQKDELGNSIKATESGKTDVRKYTQEIYALMEVAGDKHMPPLCEFVWGSLIFTGYVVSVTQRFTMFNSVGTPVRATVEITIKSSKTVDHQLRGEPRNSPDRTKSKTLNQGETLWSVANQEYEDSAKWRVIADANGIENPRKIKGGTKLKLPAIK